MRQLQRDGVIRHVGVSNYSLDRWRRAEDALGSPVIANQVEYSLAERQPDRDLVPFAANNDRLIIAYSPLAQGFLAAKYDASNRPGGVRLTNPLFLEENLTRGRELLNTLRSVAKTHGATPAQVALAWVIRHPGVVAIPGARDRAQLEANAEAAALQLSDRQASLLRQAAVSCASSLSLRSRSAASALRTSWSTDEAPGMATTLGRRTTQARATWAGVAPCVFATERSVFSSS